MPRIDGRGKVTGTTRYAADVPMLGLAHARIVPSVYAHAVIRAIDASAALAVPGVIAVLRADDLPIVGTGDARQWEPLARDEAVFAGQPVALVVAETESIAADAAALVVVDAQPLPAVVDLVAAASDDPPATYRRGATTNVSSEERSVRGDAAAAIEASDVVVEGSFPSPWAYQAYLEPHAATAWTDPDGTLTVFSATQATFFTRDELGSIFGLPTSKVRVIPAPVGGGFGSKQLLLEPLVAGATLAVARPVRLVMTRREDIAATNPAQGLTVELRLGAMADGTLTGLEARVTYDAGAYTDNSWEWFAPTLVTGPYRWPAFDVTAVAVRTNRFGTGNYRAPTGPSGIFALESLLDELAGELSLDPIDLRRRNLVLEGEPDAEDEPWLPHGARECLDVLAAHPLWVGRGALPADEGVGLAIGVWHGSKAPSSAVCRIESDGRVTVITGAVDISGAATGLAMIAAETIGVPFDEVAVVTADTSSAPRSPSSNASAITYGAGPAVQAAAEVARDRLLRLAADAFEIDADDLEVVDGMVRPIDAPDLGRPIAEIASGFDGFAGRHRPLEGQASTAHTVGAPSAAGHLAHVRVDVETGGVELLDYVVVQDVGRALNPALVEGQMAGAAVQSIGRALTEALVHDDAGQLITGSFLDYAVPRAAMLPPIETHIVAIPAPEGPFGARGIGEAAMVPGPAAIGNAIRSATGVRLVELPMTTPRLWRALADGRGRPPATDR